MAEKSNLGTDMDPEEEERYHRERKMARKARRNASNGPTETEMNLTALMDVLTIMLVFLLKSYSTSPIVNLTEDLKPPESSSTIELKEAITVTITKKDISVDEQPVLLLDGGKVRESDKVKDEPLRLAPLFDALSKKVDYHQMIERRGGARFEGYLLVVGDRAIDYELLSSVLYTAGQAQLSNFRFVTVAF